VTALRRTTAITAAIATALALGVTFPTSAFAAGELTLTATPRTSCNAGQWDPFGFVSNGPAPYFSFHCTGGAFELEADVASPASAGQYADAQIVAPSGITITSATVTGSVFYSNSEWAGDSYFNGGGAAWPNGSTNMTDPTVSSWYWGYQVYCAAASCTGAGRINLTSVKLTASEGQGPILNQEGSGNLWFQTRPGEWVWNPPGDPWPLQVAASDPSGVCSMSASIGLHQLPGPSAVPNTSVWQQCPDPTWTPGSGASVDTRDYLSTAGPLPLAISATNAAGLNTTDSETLHVDNEPVGVALSTSNDASRTVWANHAVTVFATANAGPSGLGGMNCGTGSSSSQAYTARGVTVDGDGVHTVVCTAWNNAVGPQGEPNSTTSSTAVHIDEAPPLVSFEPQQPGDPTGMVVNATDSESGVAGGSVQIAPVGSGSWTAAPTSYDGAHLLAHLDDAGLHGPYAVRATACDNVGNCATTSETLTMPLRLPAASDVGFAKIGTPAKVVREQVLVGFHYKRERRHGKFVKVRIGGHLRTIRIVIPSNTRCGHKLVKTGPHLWQETTVCRPLGLHVVTTKLVPYGKPFKMHGLLVTTQGVPIASAPVDILTAPANGLGHFTTAATATTTASGAWTARLPPGPSRIIRTVYGGSATVLPAVGQATVNVPARIVLSANSQHVPWSGVVTLRGHLAGGHVPRDGVALRLLIKLPHRSQPYEPVPFRTDAKGHFVVRWTWGTGVGVVTFPLAVATTATESDYPYAASRSRWIPVTFGAG
jgi:hypothetical protein